MKRGQGGSGYITGGGRRELPPRPPKGHMVLYELIQLITEGEGRWKGGGSRAGLPDRAYRALLK